MGTELQMETFIPYVEDTVGISIGCKERLYRYLKKFCKGRVKITKKDKEILVKKEEELVLTLYIEDRPMIDYCSEGLMDFLMYYNY